MSPQVGFLDGGDGMETIEWNGTAGFLKRRGMGSAAFLSFLLFLGGPPALGRKQADVKGPANVASFRLERTARGSCKYLVLVSRKTHKERGWGRVVSRLAEKHEGRVLEWRKSFDEVLENLRALGPEMVCIVAKPGEITRSFIVQVNRTLRRIDKDPFWDVQWGVVTGYNWWDAYALAAWDRPLVVKRVAAGCGIDLRYVWEGVTYSECVKNQKMVKRSGSSPVEERCPDDTTVPLVEELNFNRPDAFFTSGHATNRDWQIGYSYRNGMFLCRDGILYGVDLKKNFHSVLSPNPKVYCPAGNCLMGLMGSRDIMAAAWLRSGGAKQMTGYVVSTWYGALWAVNDYFLRLQGRWTFAQSFHLCQQAIVAEIMARFPKFRDVSIDDYDGIQKDFSKLEVFAKKNRIPSKDLLGLIWDKDVLVLYGDPAWEARLKPARDPDWTTKVSFQGGRLEFDVETKVDGSWRRFPAALLPARRKDWEVLKGARWKPIVADDYLALPFRGSFKKGEKYRVVLVSPGWKERK